MSEKNATKTSPLLDEESFTRLLAAAYVMQEHQDRVRAKLPATDFGQVISQIVETQHLVQSRKYDSAGALDLIAGRVQKITAAAGAAIGLLDMEGKSMHYRAASGTVAGLKGCQVEAGESISSACVRNGEKFRTLLAERDPRLVKAIRNQAAARFFLAIPVFYEGKPVGCVELFLDEASPSEDSDTRAAELMAGLVTEVLAQASESKLRQELAAERASVLMALERIKPQLEKLTGDHASLPDPISTAADAVVCSNCGHVLEPDETSCGECGTGSEPAKPAGTDLQGKWAAMWERHQEGVRQQPSVAEDLSSFLAPDHAELPDPARGNGSGSPGSLSAHSPADEWSASSPGDQDFWSSDNNSTLAAPAAELAPVDESLAPASGGEQETKGAVSALVSKAQQWVRNTLEEETWKDRLQTLWEAHKGDLSLAVAGIVIAVALVWGLWPHRTVTASQAAKQAAATHAQKRRTKPPAPQLTAFEKVLVGLGLAEPPPVPQYMGDPNVQVWVDLQSAMYYCPGAELYGNTEKGKFTTQEDAQQDQFEPAFRKPCD